MMTMEKKIVCYTRRKIPLVRKEISHKNKNNSLTSVNRRRHGFKLQSHRTNSGIRKRRLNGRETPQKDSHHVTAKHLSSSEHRGKRTSCFDHRGYTSYVSNHDAIDNKDKRQRKKRKKNNGHDETSRLQRRARYLLIKMKLEQNLIDAYSGDGWKGQSREKIKPERELQRAVKQIWNCKLGIQDVIHQLAVLSSEGSSQDSVKYANGSVHHEHIFCAKCKIRDAFPDNDIVLCAGTCNCGFHQKCLEPPLEKVPPAAQGWLCKFCKCKMEILEVINAHLGTSFTINSNWEDVFKEATSRPNAENKSFNSSEDWPSEDSGDEDYFPESAGISNSREQIESISDDSSSSNSLFCSSEEARSDSDNSSEAGYHVKQRTEFDRVDSIISTDSVEASDNEIASYKRQRKDVDYKKLHDEMFGKELAENEQQTEDEDWGPRRKKKKTVLVDCSDDTGCSNVFSNEKRSRCRRPHYRIPPNAVEKLRQVFSENELPSRDVKENLSEEFGISLGKIITWFRNARYASLKTRKEDITVQPNIHSKATEKSKNDRERKGSIEATSMEGEVTSVEESCLLPLSSIISVPKNLKRVLRKKAAKPLTTPLSDQHKRAANALTSDKVQQKVGERNLSTEGMGPTYNQMGTRITNAEHLNMPVYTRRKCRSKKKSTSVSQIDGMTYNEQLCLVEFNRLCSLEDKIQKLKKTLQEFVNNDLVSMTPHSREERVIYVPFAIVKEKE